MTDSYYELEACTDSLAQSEVAAKCGVHSIELCSELELGGLTPSTALIHEVIKAVSIPVKIMIRLRGGNFSYDQAEVADMMRKIQELKAFNIGGFVIGATRIDDITKATTLDMSVIYQLCRAAYPVPVTIHKAIDECDDLVAEVQRLQSISNIEFILSSGGKQTALDGASKLNEMLEASPKINIIGAGKVTQKNIKLIHQKANLKYYHGRQIIEEM